VSDADGLVSYSMRQGDRRGTGVELYDLTYDGNVTDDGRLTGGLGQLVDGEEGQSNFRLDPLERGVRGYEWIGWKNESFSVDRPLELSFRCVRPLENAMVDYVVDGWFSTTVTTRRKKYKNKRNNG